MATRLLALKLSQLSCRIYKSKGYLGRFVFQFSSAIISLRDHSDACASTLRTIEAINLDSSLGIDILGIEMVYACYLLCGRISLGFCKTLYEELFIFTCDVDPIRQVWFGGRWVYDFGGR